MMNIWHLVLKSMFCFDNPCAFAKTFMEEEKQCFACGECSCTQMPFYPGQRNLRMVWTDAMRDVGDCHQATGFSRTPGLLNVVRVITGWALAVKAQSQNRSREGIQRDNNNGR